MADNFYAKYSGAGGGADPNAIDGLTGDVTATGPGTVPATISNLAVTNAKIANATIDLTTKVTSILPIANGGTNSSTALNNNRVMQSSSGKIQEAAAITAARALISDANGIPTHSTVTDTELGYVSGVTSAIQTQINAKQSTSEKGVANGYASLDSGGKIPAAQLPNSVMDYLGTWAASTNTPTLTNGTGNAGDVYVASDAGTVNFGAGNITFSAGDWVIYSGTIWEKSINSNAVASVNGATGAVTVNAINELTGDVTAGPASGSASAAATIANLAVTNAKIANATIDLTTKVTGVLPVANGGAGTQTKETFVLSGTDITNQYLDLAHVAVSGSIIFEVQGGGMQLEGASYDYSVSYTGGAGGVTRVTFLNGLATGGVSALATSDVVQIGYTY